MSADNARELLDAADEGLARLAELTDINDQLAAISERGTEVVVALLSVVPVVAKDVRALGFVNDAIQAERSVGGAILTAQQALDRLIEHELTNARRLRAVADADADDEPSHSRKAGGDD